LTLKFFFLWKKTEITNGLSFAGKKTQIGSKYF
jgi:hypothetical protein